MYTMEKQCRYEWERGAYCKKRIYDFLVSTDECFIPALSGRVDIERYAQKLAQYADNLFVMMGDQDVASCSIYCNQEAAFISSIAVKQDFLRAHIGAKMMDEVKRHAKECECVKIRLEVYKENRDVLAFYQSCGFVICDYRENWMVMEWKQ